jgi:hypothetical protein
MALPKNIYIKDYSFYSACGIHFITDTRLYPGLIKECYISINGEDIALSDYGPSMYGEQLIEIPSSSIIDSAVYGEYFKCKIKLETTTGYVLESDEKSLNPIYKYKSVRHNDGFETNKCLVFACTQDNNIELCDIK